MRLAEVRAGSVYLDTNVLYMYLRADPLHIAEVRGFFSRVVRGDIEAFIGIPVFDELYYRLLLGRIREVKSGSPLDFLREKLPEALSTHGPLIEAAIKKLTTLSHINLVGLDMPDLERMLNNITKFTLLPRDALHLAIVQRLGIHAIASDDMDFDRVEGLERHWIIHPPS